MRKDKKNQKCRKIFTSIIKNLIDLISYYHMKIPWEQLENACIVEENFKVWKMNSVLLIV